MNCECIDYYGPECPQVFIFSFFPYDHCDCGCRQGITFLDITKEVIGILLPGLLLYIIWSLFQKKEVVNKNKKGVKKK